MQGRIVEVAVGLHDEDMLYIKLTGGSVYRKHLASKTSLQKKILHKLGEEIGESILFGKPFPLKGWTKVR